MSHVWTSHVTRMNESCHTYERVMSHVWTSHVTRMNESCHTYERVMPRNTGGGGSTDHAKVGLYSPLVPSALRSWCSWARYCTLFVMLLGALLYVIFRIAPWFLALFARDALGRVTVHCMWCSWARYCTLYVFINNTYISHKYYVIGHACMCHTEHAINMDVSRFVVRFLLCLLGILLAFLYVIYLSAYQSI